MSKLEVIKEFATNRPEARGIYGYGSGVFRQASYTDKDDPQIDMIFVVDDLKKWHLRNMQMNRNDYSITGRVHLRCNTIENIKAHNKITYFSQIYENGYRFKYGVIEIQDFLNSLNTWENLFVAGRFQKPVLEIKSNDDIRNSLNYNRRKAFYIATLLSDSITTEYELLNLLCGLSYMGTIRMKIAENPNKVENIVKGSYDKLLEIYNYSEDYLIRNGDKLIIDHKKAIDKLWELPSGLLKYLNDNNVDFKDLNSIRIAIYNYFNVHNRDEEIQESIATLKTNGLKRSIPYVAAKIRKRIGK